MTTRPHLATLIEDMRRWGSQLAIVEHRGLRRFQTTYNQLAQGAAWVASELDRRAIEPGDRVVLWGQNSAAWVACFFGCVLRGVLVVPLDAAGTASFAERIVRETAPRLIAGDPHLLKNAALAPRVEWLGLETVDAAMRSPEAARKAFSAHRLTLDTPLQILFTSGTTGEPKGIVHTHRNLLASLTPIEREIGKYRRYERLVHPLRILHTLPLSHIFGQFMGLWVAPVLGAVVVYESRLEASRLLGLLRRERISVLTAVPRVLALLRAELLAVHPGLETKLAALRGLPLWKRWWLLRRVHRHLGYKFWAIICGGATLPAELEEFWTTLGTALIQGYGLTETSALVTLNHPFKPAHGTLGAPLPGRELRVTAAGELLVRGEMVATTTWYDGALHAAASDDGWLATGDLARRNADGRLEFLGRTGQRLVTSAGLNVYLEDLEAALLAHDGVRAAVAFGVEGAHGPEPAAVLLAADPVAAATAVERANAALAAHQRIARWWLWPGLDLPRTPTGKVRRREVELWMDHQAAEPGSQTGPGMAPNPLLELLQRVREGHPPVQQGATSDTMTLEALGLDSLGRVQLQAQLEQASGLVISDESMSQVRTLGDLRRLAGLPPRSREAQGATTPPGAPAAHQLGNTASPASPAHADPDLEGPHVIPASTSLKSAACSDSFLYLHWPWSWPVQALRAIFLETCVRPLVWLLAAPRVVSPAGSLSGDGPALLIVANHVSSFDVPLLLYALPAPLRWRVTIAAAGEMMEAWRHSRGNPLKPAIFWLLTVIFNVFPLPRSTAFRRAFTHAGQALDRGYSVLVFPEGTRSHGGPVQLFRGGIGLLAGQAAAAVLPMALVARRSTGHALRPYAATIALGSPIQIEPGESAEGVTRRLEQAVLTLVDVAARQV